MSLQRRLSRQELISQKNFHDITNDLSSLSFENALSTQEKQYLSLRARYHAFTVVSCAQATYTVTMLSEIRQVLSEIRNPINKRTIKFLNQTPPRNPLKVGVIGCGRLGKQIVSTLLAFADVRAEEITISTRRPQILNHFSNAGVRCCFNNKEVVASSNIVFLCCLPANVPVIADDIMGYVSADCLIFSFVTGVALPRLRQTLQHNNIAKMEFTWSLKQAGKPWCIGEDVVTALEKEWVADLTCPTSKKAKEDAIVRPSSKTIETAAYAALNMCPSLGVTTDEALQLLNLVFLAKTDDDKSCLQWKHFLDEESTVFVEKGNLPVFDLFHVGTQDTPFAQVLNSGDEEPLRQMLTKKYVAVFSKFRSSK